MFNVEITITAGADAGQTYVHTHSIPSRIEAISLAHEVPSSGRIVRVRAAA